MLKVLMETIYSLRVAKKVQSEQGNDERLYIGQKVTIKKSMCAFWMSIVMCRLKLGKPNS